LRLQVGLAHGSGSRARRHLDLVDDHAALTSAASDEERKPGQATDRCSYCDVRGRDAFGVHVVATAAGRRRAGSCVPCAGDYAAVVTELGDWPAAPALDGLRLRLEPLRVEHAQEMAVLLNDHGLHGFIGGEPATARELQERYRRQVVGCSSDGLQRWCNWVVRRLDDARPVGTMQATVTHDAGLVTAEVAWVIASTHQGRGYAREAADVMVAWLRRQGAERIVAHVHPQHEASAAVARALGLVSTTTRADGEICWVS